MSLDEKRRAYEFHFPAPEAFPIGTRVKYRGPFGEGHESDCGCAWHELRKVMIHFERPHVVTAFDGWMTRVEPEGFPDEWFMLEPEETRERLVPWDCPAESARR